MGADKQPRDAARRWTLPFAAEIRVRTATTCVEIFSVAANVGIADQTTRARGAGAAASLANAVRADTDAAGEMDAFHDYISVLPSVAAVINGFIAVLVAQFFKDRTVAKVLLVVAAAILGVVAVGADFYGRHQIIVARETAAQRTKEIRNTLGNFIDEGQGLIRAGCAGAAVPPPFQAVISWQSRINAFLGKQMGRSYVQRMENLPPGFLTNTHCENANADFNKLVRIVIETNTHLEQFSQQASF